MDADDAAPARPLIRPIEPIPVETPDGEMMYLKDPAGLADEIAITPVALYLVSLMDGTRTLDEILGEFAKAAGQALPREDLAQLVAELDRRHLLDSPAFARHERTLTEAYLQAPARPAAFAGRCYPTAAVDVVTQLDAYATDPEGPGSHAPPATNPVALVAPHIDPPRGGPAYAWAYRALADAPPERVIVLGTSHLPTGNTLAFTGKDYETPLGGVKVDRAALAGLEREFGPRLYTGEIRHRNEHSLEFQMLFLRHRWPAANLVALPILCGSPHEKLAAGASPEDEPYFVDVIGRLAELCRERPTLVIASADLAHVGPQFGDPDPCEATDRRALEAADRARLEPALAGDRAGFCQAVWGPGDPHRICGFMPMYALLALLAAVAPSARGSLLSYRQWPDPRAVVTYCSIAYRRDWPIVPRPGAPAAAP